MYAVLLLTILPAQWIAAKILDFRESKLRLKLLEQASSIEVGYGSLSHSIVASSISQRQRGRLQGNRTMERVGSIAQSDSGWSVERTVENHWRKNLLFITLCTIVALNQSLDLVTKARLNQFIRYGGGGDCNT